MSYQREQEQQVIGGGLPGVYAFLTPPLSAWFYRPFAALPYLWSFALWSLLGLAALWLGLRCLENKRPTRAFIWALSWFPVMAAVSFGQNSFLSLIILSLTYRLWRSDKPLAAGLVASLLLYKPQLLPGVGFLWLWNWRRDRLAALGLAGGAAAHLLVSFWLMPEASRGFLEMARLQLPGMAALPEIWRRRPMQSSASGTGNRKQPIAPLVL